MAFTEEEKQIIDWGKANGKTPDEISDALFRRRSGRPPASADITAQERPDSVKKKFDAVDAAKNVGIGFAKGAGETLKGAISLGRGVQSLLPESLATIPGDRQAESIMAGVDLEAKNKAQMVGKVGELALEVLFPTGLLAKGAKYTGATVEGIGSRIGSISDEITEGGVKVKDRLVDVVSNLDDRTKTALTRTPKEKFEEVLQQGREAMMDDKNRTPLEAVGDSIIQGLEQIKSQTDSIGAAKGELLKRANIGYQKVGNLAQRASLKVQKSFSDMKLDAAEMKMVTQFREELKKLGANPSLREVDATIDLLQDQIYKSSRSNVLEVTDRVTGRLRGILGELNGQIKKVGGEQYTKLNEQYANSIELMGELNARLGKEGASAGSFVKRLFSPSDARTKELFEELQKRTGQDYFRDARLAKFVMEVLGDVRSKSLLEELPTSATGALGKIIDVAKKKISDPIDAAKRFIEKSGPSSSMNQVHGVAAGLNLDEEGNVTFNPAAAAVGFAGLGLAGSLKKTNKINIDSIAKKIDKEDRNIIANFLDNPNDINEFLKIQPLLRGAKVPDGASIDQIQEFLRLVMKKSNL